MDEPLKRRTTRLGGREGAKTGRRPAKLRRTSEGAAARPAEAPAESRFGLPAEAKSLIPSAGLIGVGLLLESELLVGIALGTGIVIASRWLPKAVAETVQPIANQTIEACYSAAAKTSEMLGEAAHRVESIVLRQASREERATQEGEEKGGDQQPRA